MATKFKKSAKNVREARRLGRPNGIIQPRVQQAGPERFGIVAVDCAKLRCKWMLVDFYGKVIVEPTTVECNREALRAMTLQARAACDQAGIVDCTVAVAVFGKRRGGQDEPAAEDPHAKEVNRLRAVIAEVTAENLELKKTL